MKAFGREIASQTIGGVLAAIIVAGLAEASKRLPAFDSRAMQMALTVAQFAALVTGVGALALVWNRIPRPKKVAPPPKRSSVTLSLNNGFKPSVTLTHHGPPTSYRVDGRIVEHVDGTQSPQPAPFRSQVQPGGIVGG